MQTLMEFFLQYSYVTVTSLWSDGPPLKDEVAADARPSEAQGILHEAGLPSRCLSPSPCLSFDVFSSCLLAGCNNGNSKKASDDYCLHVGTSPGSFKGMFY